MRTILSIGLLFAVSAACFAQDDRKIDTLIRSGLNRNFAAIQQEAADLDEAERLEIYNRNQMTKWLWFGAVAPFGIGNFIQKDPLWGGMVLAGEVIGMGAFITGAVMFWGPLMFIVPLFTTAGQRSMIVGSYLMPIGGITWLLSQTAGIVRAFTHLPAYNNKLRRALQLDTMTMSIEPSVSFTGHGVALTLVSATL
jgi:hypothetical protein